MKNSISHFRCELILLLLAGLLSPGSQASAQPSDGAVSAGRRSTEVRDLRIERIAVLESRCNAIELELSSLDASRPPSAGQDIAQQVEVLRGQRARLEAQYRGVDNARLDLPAPQGQTSLLYDLQQRYDDEVELRRRVEVELLCGQYCTECKRSKSEIEAAEGTSFEAHLQKVRGSAYRMSHEMMESHLSKYDREIMDLEQRMHRIRSEDEAAEAAHRRQEDQWAARRLDQRASLAREIQQTARQLFDLERGLTSGPSPEPWPGYKESERQRLQGELTSTRSQILKLQGQLGANPMAAIPAPAAAMGWTLFSPPEPAVAPAPTPPPADVAAIEHFRTHAADDMTSMLDRTLKTAEEALLNLNSAGSIGLDAATTLLVEGKGALEDVVGRRTIGLPKTLLKGLAPAVLRAELDRAGRDAIEPAARLGVKIDGRVLQQRAIATGIDSIEIEDAGRGVERAAQAALDAVKRSLKD